MADQAATDKSTHEPDTKAKQQDGTLLVEDLIEEVSIDGMCGVY